MNDGYLPIGRFARLRRLSVKQLMEEFMERSGLVMNGLHHEIYLSDVQETDPARMRTILRHPVRAA